MKFGDEIFEGEFISTVRIVCQAPPSEKEFLKVPFSISLNGENFVKEKKFRYYGDFKEAEFNLNEPDSGPSTVGTNVKIYVNDSPQYSMKMSYYANLNKLKLLI